MKSIVYFPLIIEFSIIITVSNLCILVFRWTMEKTFYWIKTVFFKGGTTSVSLIKSNILHLFANGVPDITVTNDHHLKLLNKGKIAETDHALVWKGVQILLRREI